MVRGGGGEGAAGTARATPSPPPAGHPRTQVLVFSPRHDARAALWGHPLAWATDEALQFATVR